MDRIPFARQATGACPTHADLALALAAEFQSPLDEAETALDELARPMMSARSEGPIAQLGACGEVVAERL